MAKALVGGMSLLVAISDGAFRPTTSRPKYIPAWRDDPLKSKITIRHLATHTSGIEDAEQDGLPHDAAPGLEGRVLAARAGPVLDRGAAGAGDFRARDAECVQQSRDGGAGVCGHGEPQGRRHSGAAEERAFSIRWGFRRARGRSGTAGRTKWTGCGCTRTGAAAAFTARAAARIGQLMMLAGRCGTARELVRARRGQAGAHVCGDAQARSARTTIRRPASGLAWYINADGVWPDVPRDAFAGAGAQHQVIVIVIPAST